MKTWLAAGLGVALLATAAVAAWVWWPRPAATPAARHYLDVSACLLTDPSGIAPGTPAAPVWAAMQSASAASHVMVSYLPDTGPSDVGAMLNTLIDRRCGVIIATGKSTAGVVAAGKANPHQSFLLVAAPGAATAAGMPNTVIVSAANAPGRVDHVIRALAANAPVPGS